MAYSAWDFLCEVISRTESRELNFTKERLDAVKGDVPMIFRDGDHYKLRYGTPEAWPEEPNGDMLNGFEAEKVFADMQIFGTSFSFGGKLIPIIEVMRNPDDDIEVNGS